jgi:diamine N-acetyltransferase
MISIVDAATGDIQVIRQLAEETWWQTYTSIISNEQIRYMLDSIYSAGTLRTTMENGSQHFLILYDDQGAQGFAAYGTRPEDPKIWKLHKLYVKPDNHGMARVTGNG